MTISWYGHSCFKIQTKPKRGAEDVVIITDPFDKSVGLRPPQGQANVVTVSHEHFDHNNTKALKGEPFVIDAPGEYSVKGVHLQGIESFHDHKDGSERGFNSMFVIESEDIRVCHLGDLGHKLSEGQVEEIGEVDVLMIPVGGVYTIDAKEAKEVVGQLEPRMIIPMHYKVSGLKVDITDEKEFLKLLGQKSNGKEPKLTIKKKDIAEMENHLIMLEMVNN